MNDDKLIESLQQWDIPEQRDDLAQHIIAQASTPHTRWRYYQAMAASFIIALFITYSLYPINQTNTGIAVVSFENIAASDPDIFIDIMIEDEFFDDNDIEIDYTLDNNT